jgi:DNA-binding response OmpR family regulator
MKSLQVVNVLLIEDNPSDVLLLRSALEADQISTFTLTHVERLSDGLKLLNGGSFDIILADLGLPDSSGLGTFERLRELASDVPMIVFSGDGNEEQAVHAVREGAQDYLVKSLSGFDMAARAIRYALERNKLQRSVKDSEHWFNTMFRSNPAPMGITSQSDYRIVDVNDAWVNLTGYSREEALGHTTIELGLAKPETLQQILS